MVWPRANLSIAFRACFFDSVLRNKDGKRHAYSALVESHRTDAILIDPARSRNWSDYGRVTLIKANRSEALGALAADATRPLAMARRLVDEHRCSAVVTYGGHGMVVAEQAGRAWYLPAKATEVRDVCGAGDTVLAAIGTAMLDGNCLRRACRLATTAGGRQVAELGITAVNPL